MDIFLMKKKITFTTFYNKDKRVVRRCCDGEENVNRREKKIVGWCNSSTKQVDKAIVSFAFL